jgi:hypothetical protein
MAYIVNKNISAMSFTVEDEPEPLHMAITVHFAINVKRIYLLDKFTSGPLVPPKTGDRFKRVRFKKDDLKKGTNQLSDNVGLALDGFTENERGCIQWTHKCGMFDRNSVKQIEVAQYDRMGAIRTLIDFTIKGTKDSMNSNIDKLDDLDYIFILKTQLAEIRDSSITVADLCQIYLSEQEKRMYDLNFLMTSPNQMEPSLMKLTGKEEEVKLMQQPMEDEPSGCCGARPKFMGYIYKCGLWVIYGYDCTTTACCTCRYYCCCGCCCA